MTALTVWRILCAVGFAMIKQLFTSMLAATLMGSGSTLAGTGVRYGSGNPPYIVYGSFDDKGLAAGGSVLIYEEENSLYTQIEKAYGGYCSGMDGEIITDGNTVVMTGGNAGKIVGGCAEMSDLSRVCHNKVIVAGGTVETIYGGIAQGSKYKGIVQGNEIVVTGGSIGTIYAASLGAPEDTRCAENSVSLMGKGASYSFESQVFDGGAISIEKVALLEESASHVSDNALNITGTDIQIGKVSGHFQQLNFHLLEGQLSSTDPMVTITGDIFDIVPDMKLSFDAVEGMTWKPGDSITLIEAQKGLSIAMWAIEYNIYQNGNPEKILATAQLDFEQGQGTTRFLKLVITSAIPEPTTGTLSLLALAALAARRRRK